MWTPLLLPLGWLLILGSVPYFRIRCWGGGHEGEGSHRCGIARLSSPLAPWLLGAAHPAMRGPPRGRASREAVT